MILQNHIFFSDYLYLIKDIFFISIVLFSICIYALLEKFLIKKNKSVSFFYSVSLYLILLFNFYLGFLWYDLEVYYYLFNFSWTNLYAVDFFKLFLVFFFILIFYAGISEKSFQRFKYIPFESLYILFFVFLGMLYLLYSFDFLMMFLNLELQNFSLYILMNIQRNQKNVVETCIKYYIIGDYLRVFFYMVFLLFMVYR